MYVAYYIFIALGVQFAFGSTFGPYIAVILAGPVLFIVGYGVHQMLISRVTGTRTAQLEGEGQYAQLVLTLGISSSCRTAGKSSSARSCSPFVRALEQRVGDWPVMGRPRQHLHQQSACMAALLSIATIVVLALLINRTRLGKSLRAAADNPDAATSWDQCRSRPRIAFGLGSAITAVAGGLLATNYPFNPFVGLEYVIVMYAGVVLGGMGSIMGAFWGGMTIGSCSSCRR